MRVGTVSLSLAATPLREPVMTLAPSLVRLLSFLISKPSFDNSSLVSFTMVAAFADVEFSRTFWMDRKWTSGAPVSGLGNCKYQLLYHRDIGGFIHHQAVAVCVLYLHYYFILQRLAQQQKQFSFWTLTSVIKTTYFGNAKNSPSSNKDMNLRLAISSLANQYADRKAWCNPESFVCSWVTNSL